MVQQGFFNPASYLGRRIMENPVANVNRKKTGAVNIRKLAMTGMLAAVSTVLMFVSFNVPLMPGFIKMDFSDMYKRQR